MQAILGLGLFYIEREFQTVDIHGDAGHGIYAPFVEDKGIVAAVGVAVVDHGLVFVGHSDVLIGECPAGERVAGFGRGAGGIGVEIVGVGQVAVIDGAVADVGEVAFDGLVGRDGKAIGGVGGKDCRAAGPVGEGVVGIGSGTERAGCTAVECTATSHSAASGGVGRDGDGITACEVGLEGAVG